MKSNVIQSKSYKFALSIIKLYEILCNQKEDISRKDAKTQRFKENIKKSFLGELGGFARESFLHAGVGAKAGGCW
jgi:Na+/H+ antiporter NhaB